MYTDLGHKESTETDCAFIQPLRRQDTQTSKLFSAQRETKFNCTFAFHLWILRMMHDFRKILLEERVAFKLFLKS